MRPRRYLAHLLPLLLLAPLACAKSATPRGESTSRPLPVATPSTAPETPAPATPAPAAAGCPIAIASGAPANPATASLIDAVVDAHGGRDVLERMQTYRLTGEVTAHIRGDAGTVRRDFVAPDKLRVELAYPTRTEIRVLDGAQAWRGDVSGQKPVAGMPHTAMVYQLVRSNAALFLDRCRAHVIDAGQAEHDGTPHAMLRLPWSKELVVDVWIDASSHRVAHVRGTLIARGMQMSFETSYRDYRELDGAMIPFREEGAVGGRRTATTVVSAVSFGAADLGPFAPAPVTPPAADPDTPR